MARITYKYRPEVMVTASDARRAIMAQAYDYLYQRTQSGEPVGWQMGTWFPITALEEGVPRHKVQALMDALDAWMAGFMMANQVKWEKQNARR